VVGEELFFTPPPTRPTPRIREALETGRPGRVPLAGRSVATWSWGSGPRVYLMHGWGGLGGQLADFVPPLLRAGFSVVAFDAPGHGASGGRKSSAPEFAAALQAVAAAYGPPAAIVAHSLGAVAASLAVARGLPAQALVYLGPASGPDLYVRRFAAMLGLSRAATEAMRRRAEQRLGIAFADLRQARLAREASAPLLVIHDRDDAEVPWREGAAVAEAWPGAQLLTTSGLGHRRPLRDPDVLRAAVAFLAAAVQPSDTCEGCGGPLGGDWDPRGRRCAACALDAALYQRDVADLGTGVVAAV
jgi:pimeloyl-ACP methyl ester carboxylesterase